MRCSELRQILAEVEEMCGDLDVNRPSMSIGDTVCVSIEEVEIKRDMVECSYDEWRRFKPSIKPPYVVLT